MSLRMSAICVFHIFVVYLQGNPSSEAIGTVQQIVITNFLNHFVYGTQ